MLGHATIQTERPPEVSSCAVLRIGSVSVAVHGVNQTDLGTGMMPFVSPSGTCDIRVLTDSSSRIQPFSCEPSFESGALWSMFRDGNEFVFDFTTSRFGTNPYKRMRVNSTFNDAQITVRREMGPHGSVSPLEYPADELLITNYLACHGLGVEVHGCGLIDRAAGGQLFLGHSGAGKSTTARMWDYFRSPNILSDDRIILRFHDGELWMYGTPWHGEAEFAAPAKVKLSRIFILQHGKSSEIRLLPKAQAVGEMFARSFPPFHSAEGLDRTVEFLSRIADRVPCYGFQFVPDESAVEAVLSCQ